jgi:hypothetical protein
MAVERYARIELDDGTVMLVVADTAGPVPVGAGDITGALSTITSSVERVSRDVLEAVKRAAPSKATVELMFGVAIEAGHVVALFGKPKGEASIRVVLEWSGATGHTGGADTS